MSSEHTDTPIYRLSSVVDRAIYRVEVSLVTIAALIMTATVTLAIVHRSFEVPDSLLAKKLLTFLGWFGVSKTPETLGFLQDWITPTILCLIVFFVAKSMYGAWARRHGDAPGAAASMIAGVVGIAIGYGLIKLVLNVPSRWVCTGLVLGGCGLWLIHALRNARYFDAVLSVVLAYGGYLACATLKPGYNWAQELSLILLAWMAFLGGSMATRAGRHIQVDALSKLIPKSLRPWSRAIGLCISTLFCAYLTYLAYRYVFGAKGDFYSGALRPATRLPAWVIIFSAVVSFGLMTIRFGAMSIDAFIHRREEEKELVH